MSTIEEAIYNRSVSHVGMLAWFGDRIYPVQLPREVDYPALRYSEVSYSGAVSHDTGPAGLGRSRYQFDVYAETATEAQQAGEQVRLCWEGFKGTVDGIEISSLPADRREMVEADSNLFRVSLDYFIWHSQATE